MIPAPSHRPRQARNTTIATVPHGMMKRPAPSGVVTASAVLRTIPKTTRQPAMPSEYSDAPTTGPNPRIVARQGAKIAPPKTIRTAATTRLSVRSTLAGWPSVVAKPNSPGSRIPPPRTRPAQTRIFVPFDRLLSGVSVSPAHAGVNTAPAGAPITAGVKIEPSGAPIPAGIKGVARVGKLDTNRQPRGPGPFRDRLGDCCAGVNGRRLPSLAVPPIRAIGRYLGRSRHRLDILGSRTRC